MKDGILKLMYGMGMVIAVNIITPTGKYEKQVKFISALIFTILVLNVFSVFRGAGTWESIQLSGTQYIPEDYEIPSLNDYIMEEYISSLRNDMKKRLSKLGDDISVDVLVVNDVNSPEYGEIKSVVIENISDEDKDKAEKLINSFYGVDFPHISFYGKEE